LRVVLFDTVQKPDRILYETCILLAGSSGLESPREWHQAADDDLDQALARMPKVPEY